MPSMGINGVSGGNRNRLAVSLSPVHDCAEAMLTQANIAMTKVAKVKRAVELMLRWLRYFLVRPG